MPDNILKGTIQITAPGVKQTVADVESSVSKMEASVKKTITPLDTLQSHLEKVARAKLNIPPIPATVPASIEKASKSLQAFKTNAKGADQALLNLSRVVQDAPFGFIGIANNLNPLLESFQRLQKETGSSGKAMKALASSMLGAGGVGLALAAVQFAALGGFDAFKKLASVFGPLKKNVVDINSVLDDAAKNVGKDVAQLEIFKNKLNDVSLKESDRIKIAKAYNDVADETNKIDIKQINNLDLINKSIEKQNSLILQRAIALSATSKLGEFADRFVDAQLKVSQGLNNLSISEADYIAKARGFSREREALTIKIATTGGITSPGETSRATFMRRLAALDKQLIKELGNNTFDLLDTINARDKAQKEMNDATAALSKLITIPGITKPPPKQGTKGKEFNFFDEFLSFDPTKVKEKSKDAAQAYGIAIQFALENQDIFVGLDKILTMDTKTGAIKEAAKFWADFQNGLVRLKPTTLKPFLPENFSTKPGDVNAKLDPNRNLPKNLERDVQAEQARFKDIGHNIGKAIGNGFDEELSKRFGEIFENAFKQGISQDKLNKFLEGVAISSSIATQGINGIGDAFGDLTTAILNGEDGLKSFADSLKSTFTQLAAQLVKTIVLASILKAITAGSSEPLSFAQAFGKVLGFSRGGIVPGTGTRDTVPALLTPGELVVPREFTQKFSAMIKSFNLGTFNPNKTFEWSIPTPGAFANSAANQTHSLTYRPQSINVNVSGTLHGRGDSLLGVITTTQKAQGRTV